MRMVWVLLEFLCLGALGSDEAALLKAIAAYPGEDTPRLAYADYLDEHGQSDRAKLIRLQIERANLPPHSPRRSDLLYEEWCLFRIYPERWLTPDLAGYAPNEFEPVWERGFVTRISVAPELLGDKRVRTAIGALDFLGGIRVMTLENSVWQGNPVDGVAALPNVSEALRTFRSSLPFQNLHELTVRVDVRSQDLAERTRGRIRSLLKGPHNLIDARIHFRGLDKDPDSDLLRTFRENRERLRCFQVLSHLSST